MKASSITSPTWPPRAVRIAWVIVGVGVALRLIRYAANRSLWLDEAYLAESILSYSLRQLATEPLLHWQAAPVGFLLLEKLAAILIGTSEYALRFVPLVAGLASVPLFAAVARRCLPQAGGLAALAMFAGLEPLVYYSAEVKQYAVDVACALAIVVYTLRLIDLPASLGRLVTLGVVGAVSIFLSHASVFVLAAVGFITLPFAAARTTIVGAAWVVLFAVNYVLFLRPLAHHGGLAAYWAAGYMPWDRSAIVWLWRALCAVYTDYGSMWLPLPYVCIGATAFGAAWLWARNRRTLALCALPILITLAAAAAHRYPFSGRLILFLVPCVVLMIGAGLQAVVDVTSRGRRVIAWIMLAAVLGPTLGLALYYVAFPGKREEMKTVLAYVRDHRQAGDVLYVWNISQVPFNYYRDRVGLGDVNYVIGENVEPTAAAYEAEFAKLRAHRRVWVLMTHWAALGGPDERTVVLPVLGRMGKRLDIREAKGASVTLYEMAPSEAPVPDSPPR